MSDTEFLKSEKKRRRPPLGCACASLRRAARAVTQFYERELRGTGLKATQYSLIQAIGTAGEIGQGRLGDYLALDTTTLSRTLKTVEQSGWIVSIAGTDRRERYWRLTQAGRDKWDEARPHWKRAQQKLRENLDDTSWEDVLAASNAITWAATSA